MPRTSRLLPAVLAAASLAAGCGGDSDQGPIFSGLPAGGPMTKPEFLAEANRICVASESQIEAAADELVTAKRKPSRRQVAHLVKGVVVPALEGEVQAIAALEPPRGDDAEVREILAATRRGIEAVMRDPGALIDGPPAELRAANRLAHRYGAERCGLE